MSLVASSRFQAKYFMFPSMSHVFYYLDEIHTFITCDKSHTYLYCVIKDNDRAAPPVKAWEIDFPGFSLLAHKRQIWLIHEFSGLPAFSPLQSCLVQSRLVLSFQINVMKKHTWMRWRLAPTSNFLAMRKRISVCSVHQLLCL
jgi:hypothetical protein